MGRLKLIVMVMALVSMNMLAWTAAPWLQDDPRSNRQQRRTLPQEETRQNPPSKGVGEKKDSLLLIQNSLLLIDDEEIPDSLLHPRWRIQRTQPVTEEDLKRDATDLIMPENIEQKVEYNDTLGGYLIGSKMGGRYLGAPVLMTAEEFGEWCNRQLRRDFFRKKNDEIYQAKGKEKFDFTDMHFDLGPAEKIFGPGGVRVKTQGTAELKLGATMKNVDNPSLPIRNRKTTTMNFDEKINLSVNGKVGDKVNMNLNYNTDATFDYDAQNMKLKYDGKEDEIIKLVEGGNVTFPSNSTLVRGASSLFGIRTDLQFGKLKLQTVVSQKKSSSKSVSGKGGTQMTPFEMDVSDYEENRHFFLSSFFREKYNAAMKKLPNVVTGITINRVEVWVTNKTGNTANTRHIVAFNDLGDGASEAIPSANNASPLYSLLTTTYADARNIEQTTTVLDGHDGLEGGFSYEKMESVRLLSSSEYTVNKAMGYISLKTALQTDQVLAVAFEYTYNGQVYQVGEFAADVTGNTSSALYVKSLKNTSQTPSMSNWKLMMRNVYYLASSVEKDKFRLDVKYQSDTAGVYLSYIPEKQVKDMTLIKLMGADRLDNNDKAHSNGYFDYVSGYTVANGRVFFPSVEPFGKDLCNTLERYGVERSVAEKYAFTELYDTTKVAAKQVAEKDKYLLKGQFRGTRAKVYSLGAYNVPQGSVEVKANGQKLVEGVDYSVNYSAGEVTILNQSLLDSDAQISATYESNTDYGQMRKTMLGMNWEYDFSKNFQLSGTVQHLSEQSLTTKVAMGSEPLNNTIWGVNMNWKKESQWLTNVLDKLPGLHLTQPSQISFTGEFAQLIAGQPSGTQDNASYVDDFENTANAIDVSAPASWIISSVPSTMPNSSDKTSVKSGYDRALLAWYNIDPLFTRQSSSLTPGHIRSDLEQLSNHYVREIYVRELFPNRDQSTYSGATSQQPVLNLAYYPQERGPYNLDTNLNPDGTLPNPSKRWGGMMRKLDTNDFETANVEYIEFWLMDPFAYTGDDRSYGGELYIDLGEVSEDVLHDGKKFDESSMSVDGSSRYTTTQWGKISTSSIETYAFATTTGSRALQDVGFNGLNDEEERSFGDYQAFLQAIRPVVSDSAYQAIAADPANDNYHYFRGSDYDQRETSILERYKRINMPQGNSPDSETRAEGYDTSYKTTPDVEDINLDHTLNEYEKYFHYHVSLHPGDTILGENFIVDKRIARPILRNGKQGYVTWYQYRIPLNKWEDKFGSISDFSSIRFMRMYLTGFEKPVVLRFGTLDLVRGEWRVYEKSLNTGSSTGGEMAVSAVNIEENNDKTPVNYVLPPGIRREQDPTQPQLVESNEQALSLEVENLGNGESKAVYRSTALDMRQYRRLQMFVHANATEQNVTNLKDKELAVFVRLGSDYKNNYYEYLIPLDLTPPGHYDRYSSEDCRAVWPENNMLDVPLDVFTAVKKARNKAKAENPSLYGYHIPYSYTDPDRPNNTVTVVGNPTLGDVKTMMVGVRNMTAQPKSGEVWVNELRLQEYNNTGGWAAQGALNVQLSDLGTVNMSGKYTTEGFGGLEEGVAQRSTENYGSYSLTTNLELGKFFPDKAKVSAPLYYSVTKERSSPKYNPLDTDMRLEDALEAADSHEKDSIENIAVTKTTRTNFSLTNMRVGIATKRHPMPYDPANLSFSYSHSHSHTQGETTVYENEDQWRGALSYNYTPVYKAWEPFKKPFAKSKSKWLEIFKRFGFNWLPQNVSFNTEMTRHYRELQERDMEQLNDSQLPLVFSEQFLWNRDFSIRWDLTKNLHMNFQSATHAQIEEPYTVVNKDLYPTQYEAWKDSVWTSIKQMGMPLDYQQNFTASYQLPLNLIPIFDWVNANASYNSTYRWMRGTSDEDGTSYGNTISNTRQLTIDGNFGMEKLYNQIPFLKKANERFSKTAKKTTNTKSKAKTGDKDKKDAKDQKKDEKALPKNKRAFEQEITLLPDTSITVTHSKNSKRLIVSAKTKEGKAFRLKYKVVDQNKIKITTKVDSQTVVKIAVTAKEPYENKSWYKTAQVLARGLMMVRNVSFNYRDQYSMALPGFLPMIGNAFGQRRGDLMSPGLDFAFGMVGEGYLNKAVENNWLLMSDSIATPATTNSTKDLQLRMTLEPVRDLKIDLNASHTQNKARSIQYMYGGMPAIQSGTFSMTTLSLGSALEGIGDANTGYHSNTFEKFCNSIAGFRDRVQSHYEGTTYPVSSSWPGLSGKPYDEANGGVLPYSGDVLIPAFLNAYTAGNSGLDIFPTIAHMLPNWSIRYSGLGQLPWFSDHFKSVNINHAYKSIYAVGAYTTYSTFMEYMNGLGFISDVTSGNPVPSSMYSVSTVSINEAFSPLLGVDLTFLNNLTCKFEYRTTRVITLSMTSVQINEALSKDWVVGMGYKINNFDFFGLAGGGNSRKVKGKNSKNKDENENKQSNTTSKKGGVNHDLNLRLDFSFRNQAAISRDIATMTSAASSGNKAIKLAFNADYSLSRMLTMSFFYDQQTNTPLLSSSSYPTTTRDFGLSLKFSLTR